MGWKRKIEDKIQCMLYDRPKINRHLAKMKQSFDEVYCILNVQKKL